MKPEIPQGYRRVETHENVLATDLYMSKGWIEWLLIGEHRVKYVNEDRYAWPNIIRLAAPEAKTEISGGSNAINVNGLTARDWFAGQALAGLMANPDSRQFETKEVADIAYRNADAMMMEGKVC